MRPVQTVSGSARAGIGRQSAAAPAAREVDGAPARRRMPVELGPDRGGVGRQLDRASRRTQARWPSSLAAALVRLALDEGGRRGGIDEHQRAQRPGERLLDIRLGVADEVADEPEAVDGDSGVAARRRSTKGSVAIVEPTRRRSHSDGE